MTLDSTGFKRKRFADLYAEIEAKAKEVFGQQLNTSERSPMGIILRLFAWFLSKAWQNTEDVYYSAYPNTAEGVSLFRLGPYAGITQLPATRATTELIITGTPNYTVKAGFRASYGSIVFETTRDINLGDSGSEKAPIQALEYGRTGNVPAGTITTIVNPSEHVFSVTNPTPATGGREVETPKEFRERFSISTDGMGKGTLSSIRAALLKTKGVRAATVVENYQTVKDANGRPPKSFEAYVLGGAAQDIGETIFNNKAAGIEPYGTESVTVIDDAGFEHTMKFSYAAEIPIYLKMTVTTNTSFPFDGVDQIKTAAIRYIGGKDADDSLYTGLNMGAKVVHSALVAIRSEIDGISDLKVEISKDGSTWVQDSVSIAPSEVAQTAYNLITVVKV
ncbi:baseplate J/gp47 family protein [Paenibacillus sp. 32352]|uniref:baseplate J/gp47 family protein n=1 Tax=Paenibacillus sp. 32352 TaxID=1969111 RepID=UPI0009AD5412|nr:baseplate J/gp47 family protein [Paenibacillus sp. 32352]